MRRCRRVSQPRSHEMTDTPIVPAVVPHGSHRLPAVDVDSYTWN
jgi:hypothetical protein